MTLVRRYGHLVLKFSPPYLSSTGRYEASWVGGNADASTEGELLALIRAAMGDCGGEGHLWTYAGQHEKDGDVFIIQELACADCPPQWRKIPAAM